MRSEHAVGAALVAVSAAAFGAMAIFGVWAFDAGTTIWALLVVRFAVATAIMLAIVTARRIALPPWPRSAGLVAMGAIGYVGQAFCYFSALHYAQASLVALLLYLYPAFVAILAVTFLRDRLHASTIAALVLAFVGTTLVVGGGTGRPLGIVLGIGSAVIYSIYIVAGTKLTAGLHPLAVTTVICASAAGMAGVGALIQAVTGDGPTFPGTGRGWVALLAIAVLCTVVAILTFFAGLQLLGPTRTALLSTLEPVVTVALAIWLLDESLSGPQLAGAALVLLAVTWQATARRPQAAPPA